MRSLHPLVLLLACLFVAAALTHVLPAGKFERRDDPATGRQVVVAGTYQRADPAPVGPFQALVAIPRGLAEASGVIFFVFLVGGGFTVVEQTGASTRAVQQVVARLGRSQALVIPLACAAFGLGGVLIQMSEELLAFVPVLLLLTARLGYPPVVACAVSIGASAVGAAAGLAPRSRVAWYDSAKPIGCASSSVRWPISPAQRARMGTPRSASAGKPASSSTAGIAADTLRRSSRPVIAGITRSTASATAT